MTSAIKIKIASKYFKNFRGKTSEVLSDINLEINQGEFFIILGPSGCGKSTLLRIMSGLDKEFKGNIEMGIGNEKDIGFVFQEFSILPWLNTEQNISLGLVSKKFVQEKINHIVKRELKFFGLEKHGNYFPRELSGGQKQRIGLARAFAPNPKILFMDEPFSSLDSFTAKELREELLKVWQERKTTIIMVTHSILEAIELADRVAVMSSLPGKIEKIVDIPIIRPRSIRSKEVFDMEDKLYELVKP